MVSLRRALSARGRVSEKVADDFLNALTESIQEGLKADGNVTISGLGTFKLQDMPARESVNVTTGERITIEGYKKVVFTQGAARAKAAKQTEEPIDPIKKLGEQAEEIKDILSEISAISGDNSLAESSLPENSLSDSSHRTTPPQPPINGVETCRQAGLSDNGEGKEPENEPTIEPASTEQPQHDVKEEEKKENGETKKPFNPWLTGLITIGVFAMLLVIAFFVLRHSIIHWAENMRSNLEQRVNKPEQSTVVPKKTADFSAEAEKVSSTENTEQAETRTPTKPNYYNDAERKFTEWQATEIVGQDSRLAWVAKKHYGEKELWVFIYEANRDKLNAADYVLPGMELRIPKLPAELRDVNNPQTKALLERLSKKYLQVNN